MKEKLNILLLGSGGREHAFARSIAMSSRCDRLFCAPGNAGTALHGTNVSISPLDFNDLKEFVFSHSIDLVIVGPEDPLVNGVVDFFRSDEAISHIPVIGPSAEGARLEGSKDFSKAFMHRHGIPTAAYRSFRKGEYEEACRFLSELSPPYVLKADGLAAGKGVLILQELEEAKQRLEAMLDGTSFGKAGEKVVIESFLNGIEMSVFVLTDGKNYVILPEAKDYKRIGVGDTGPNTGGMGAVSPVPFAGTELMHKVEERIIKPTIAGLAAERIDYRGFLFIGLMIVSGEPFVIEYNCRMGDPETEVVLPRIRTDLVELLCHTAEGTLDGVKLETDLRTAVTVVMVSGGYPGTYEKGYVIRHLDKVHDTFVYHAGTVRSDDRILTAGGRVLALTTLADTLPAALDGSYKAAQQIDFDYAYYRNDIGRDLM